MAGRYGLRLGSGGMGYDFMVGPVDFDRMKKERQIKARNALKRNGVGVGLLFRPENIRYATGNISRGLMWPASMTFGRSVGGSVAFETVEG